MPRKKPAKTPAPKKEKSRILTAQESMDIILPYLEAESFIKFENHRYYPYKGLGENVYRFTVNLLSLDFLISLMENPSVSNVYFTPAAPNPGSGIDGISLVYKVYVRYLHIKE